jgi:hypothetical protein
LVSIEIAQGWDAPLNGFSISKLASENFVLDVLGADVCGCFQLVNFAVNGFGDL